MTHEELDRIRENVAIYRHQFPQAEFPETYASWRLYAETVAYKAIEDAKLLLSLNHWKEAREHLQFAADMLGGEA